MKKFRECKIKDQFLPRAPRRRKRIKKQEKSDIHIKYMKENTTSTLEGMYQYLYKHKMGMKNLVT